MNGNTAPNKDQAAADFIAQMENTSAKVADINDKIDVIVMRYRCQKMVALCEIVAFGGSADYITDMDMLIGPGGEEILQVIVPTMSVEALPTLGMIESAWRMVGGDYSAIICKGEVTATDEQITAMLGGSRA